MGAIERAAEAIHQLSNSDPWEREHPYLRGEYRDDARAAFESVDVDELARALQQRAAYEGVVILDHPAPATYLYPEAYQEIARRVKAWLVGEET